MYFEPDHRSKGGLTRERVRQIQVDALKRLREILMREGLSAETIFNQTLH